ncbi:MAG: 16S rRNA (cytidine(1402)-2'-O)-methyltransferase, partial [Pseudonocardiaceae bacterium]
VEFGADRPAAVCRELTKTYEEVRRAPLGELAQWARGGVRGEITLVVAGAQDSVGDADAPAIREWIASVQLMQRHGISRKQAIGVVAELRGARKRDVYNAVVAALDEE